MTTQIDESVKREVSADRNNDIAWGLSLCEKKQDEGGWADYFSKEDGTDIEDQTLKGQTAIMLENSRRWMNGLDESTLSTTVGGFRDFIFPIIRASFPNNPINEIVSVQPQTRRNGTIYWMNYVIGQTRGAFARGQTLFDANTGWQGRVGYTDNAISGEIVGAAVANATQTGTLAEYPVVAGKAELSIVDGAATYNLRDNGNGALAIVSVTGGGVKTISASSINYITGAFSVTFSAALAASGAITASYDTNTEGQYIRAQVDIEMQSAGVQAIRRAVGMRISMESMQDFQSEFGMDLSQTIITGASQQLMADVGGEVVADLWQMAGTAVASFSLTVPTGVNRAEHYRDIAWELAQASGAITDATQRGEATFYIVDQNALNVFETMGAAGGYVKAGDTHKGQGLVYVGDMNGKRVYRYKYMSTFPGASTYGNILVGYKGSDWWDTGYVHAPYQSLYSNGPDERADLTRRQGFAMRYSKKKILNSMYRKVSIVA